MKKIGRIIILFLMMILFMLIEIDDVQAGDTYTIVPGSTATLKSGKEVNFAIKQLANPSIVAYDEKDGNITSIEWTNDTPPSGVTYKNLSKSGSDVLAYLDGTVVKVYTTAETVYLNEDSSHIFYNFQVLESLSITNSRLNTSNVTNFNYMFSLCFKLSSLDLNTWQVTNKCTTLVTMFGYCYDLKIISCDFNSWDVSNVTTFSGMFYHCDKLTSLDLSNWQVTDKCTSLTNMFSSCSNLNKIKLFNTYNISSENKLKRLFSINMMLDNNEDGISDDNVARRDAIKDTNSTDKQIYIKYVPQPATLISGRNFNAKIKSLVTPSATYYTNDTTITSIEWSDVAPADGVTTIKVSESGTDVIGYLDGTVVKLYTTVDTVYLNEDSSDMFYKFQSLETLLITESKLDSSNVTDFSLMFDDCIKLTSLDLSNWNVSNGIRFYYTFSGCRKLTTIDLSNWCITNKCTSLENMFGFCDNLETIICNFNTWDISNVTNFSKLFYLTKISSLDLTNWRITNKCTNLQGMFSSCMYLDTLLCDFTTWDTSNVTDFRTIFWNCNKLTSIDISTWQFNDDSLYRLFYNCSNLIELHLPTTASVTSLENTFGNCSKLLEIDLSNWTINIQDKYGLEETFNNCLVAEIKLPDTINFNKCESFYYLFHECKKLTEMPECFKQPNLDLTNIKYFTSMFNGTSLISVDLSNWITSSNAKKYIWMFQSCTNLTQITGLDHLNMNGIDRSDYVSISIHSSNYPLHHMFAKTKITELDISSWNITIEEPFSETFSETLEKIKMCNTSNISEANLTNLFSNDMVLDNNEDGVGDDSVLRRTAIKDVNSTDKQIYIKYVAPTYSVLTTGQNFNAKIKSLVTPSATYSTYDTTITSIEWTDVEPADGVTTVKVSDSGADVIGYSDGSVVKLYTTVDTVYLNEDSSYMFCKFKALETIQIIESKLNASNVKTFSYMFHACQKVAELDLSNWQVTDKCTSLYDMFDYCINLEILNLSNWDVSNVTNFSNMFINCSKLATLDISNWQVTNKCTNVSQMFNQCKMLTSLDVSTWDVSNITNFGWMFDYCEKLTALDLSSWNVTNKCNNLHHMFYACKNLENLDLSNWDVSNITDFSDMFYGCTKLHTLDLTNWQVTNKCNNLKEMFGGCNSLTILNCDFTTWNVSNVTKFDWMFGSCEKFTTLDLSSWHVTDKCTNLNDIFYGCKNLATLICDFTTWDVSNVTDSSGMFYHCEKLTELDLSNWKITNKCAKLGGMFAYCYSLESLTCDFTTWDVSNVTDFNCMFSGCRKLTSLDLTNWQVTNKCTSLAQMFNGCNNLETLTCDFTTWDVSNTISFTYMFYGCKKLTSLDLSTWQVTNKCIYLNDMFSACNKLTTLELFDTSFISADISMPNLPMTMKLDDDKNKIADSNTDYTTAIRDTTSGTNHTYIKATNSILLDYNGGTLNDETTHRIYYLSDGSLVTVNSLDEYLPTKDGNIANGWTRNNVDVTFPLNISGIQNVTLTAKYPVTYHVFIHSNDIYDENGYPVGDSKVIDITCTAGEDISVALKNAYISATNVPLTGHNQLTAHGLIAVYDIPNNKYVVSGIDEEPVERRLYIPTISESTSSITHIIPDSTINATGVLYNFSATDGTRVDLYVLWNWDDIQRDHDGNSYADIYTRNIESDPFRYVHVVIVKDRYSNKQNLVKCNWN